MIRLEGVTKRYPNGQVAVDALSLEVPDGALCVLVGPSGSGKTTTLKMVNRLIEPTSGRIFLADEDVTDVDPVQLRRRIGYVIQQVGLFPHQTVGDNVATVPRLLKWDRARVRARVDELLELVGLDPSRYRDRYPEQLSGGQRQRVGVARALGADPPVLLMDEPFGAVDPITRHRLQDELLHLQATVRKTIVLVTHDIDEAVKLGDRIAVLAEGGVLAQYGTPSEILARPADDFVADFVGAGRGLMALQVQTVADAQLAPATTAPASSVDVGATLATALSALLLSDDGHVGVTRDGDLLGVLTLDAVHARGSAGVVADERTMRERMLAGDLYLADDPELVAAARRARRLQDAYNRTGADEDDERRQILTTLLGTLGEGTEIRPPFWCDYGSQLHVGARCFANYGLVALDVATITIGDDVQLGPNVQLLTPTHPLEPEPRRARWEAAAPITIGSNVWLGGGVIVLPGVTIGDDTVVGAGAVVTRDIPAGVVAVGNPARVVRSIS